MALSAGDVLVVLILIVAGYGLMVLGSIERLQGSWFRLLVTRRWARNGLLASGGVSVLSALALIAQETFSWLQTVPPELRTIRLQIFLGLTSLFVVSLSALLVWVQIRRNHDWNRRHAAHALIFDSNIGRFRELRDQIEDRIHIHESKQTWDTEQGSLKAEDKLALEAILNYLENVCLAVKNHVVDEDIAYESLGSILPSYRRWADPFIEQARKIDAYFWIQMDWLANRWVTRKEDAQRQVREGVVVPGKPKL